ncbi:MAG: hypothetical protein ACM3X7_04840 [Solirubrobacterales bacterium]
MKIGTLIGLIITAIILAILGILSIYKPNIAGAEFSWVKYKCIYLPKYINPTNKYYLNYIKIIGVGFILSSLVLLIVSVVYVFYPNILFMI